MKYTWLLLIGSMFAACNTTPSSETGQIKADFVVKPATAVDTVSEYVENKMQKSDIDFLSVCDSLEIWQGGIQGVPKSDSTGVYVMAQCASNKSFDLIIYADREVAWKEATDYPDAFIKAGIRDAVYYAFEIPKHKSIDLSEELATYDYFFHAM